jgi:hypothetical protein
MNAHYLPLLISATYRTLYLSIWISILSMCRLRSHKTEKKHVPYTEVPTILLIEYLMRDSKVVKNSIHAGKDENA